MIYLFHSLIEKFYQKKGRAFFSQLKELEVIQKRYLKKYLSSPDPIGARSGYEITQDTKYEEFSKTYPLTTYETYSKLIEVKKDENSLRFQPTSGSTHSKKWIPYTNELLKEFDEAIAPWLHELYTQYPKIKEGKHYWSLSWIPDELRQTVNTSDLEVFGLVQKFIMKKVMAVPEEVSLVKTSKAAQIATLSYLCAESDLTMIFVWSPTFALSLFDLLYEEKETLSKILFEGDWGIFEEEMNGLQCPKSSKSSNLISSLTTYPDQQFFKKLWPKMALISSWDTASSKIWAKKLRSLFPDCDFQGKGLFATEGVVTIPYKNHYILSYKSHFYEFKDLHTHKIHPSWELIQGQIVSPIITTGSGFFRYQMNDALRVTNHFDSIPCFEFLGRLGDVDLVGEKISPDIITLLFKELGQWFSHLEGISAFGVEAMNERPFYLFLLKGTSGNPEIISLKIDQFLKSQFHYALARDLNQLGSPKIIISEDCYKILEKISLNQGMISGNMKVEILKKISSSDLKGIEI